MTTGRKIILAEDNLADVELTKIAFREIDIPLEVVHVFDGQELLNYLATEPLHDVALILMDLNMPRMGGIEVLKNMYKDEELRKLPIVVLSSSKHEVDVQTCYTYGANAYVCKPIDMDEFQQTINAIAYFWCDINVLPSFKAKNSESLQ